MPDELLAQLLRRRGIRDARILAAVGALDRSEFVPAALRSDAATDAALSIGYGQTISQPFVVAYMTEQALLAGNEKVLEVGTGSGYQAAVLAPLCRELWSIERRPQLAWQAQERLTRLGLEGKIHLVVGDGMAGLPGEAPFDAILVTAAAPEVPPALVAQLAPGGRLLIPVGPPEGPQHLVRITRRQDGTLVTQRLLDVVFVPLLPGVVEAPSA